MAFRRSPAKLDGPALYALRLLAQRPHSTGELRKKLRRRASDVSAVVATLDKLREYGLADDRQFSEAFASARLHNQGFGQQRILRDLRTKLVGGPTAEEAIAKVYASTDETELIGRYLERKYRGKDLPALLQDDKTLQGAYRRLRMAGFSSAGSISALRRYKADLPDPSDEGPTEEDPPEEEQEPSS